MHPAKLPPKELLAACAETRTRRSGPGGQHRNKVETAVILVHNPTGIAAEASERRSQAENRGVALRRLRFKLAIMHRTPAVAGPSPTWHSRTRGGHLAISVEHDDYPALLAEAFDQLHNAALEVPRTAAVLGVTPSQLLRLFRRNTAAWEAFNRLRTNRGLRPLK